ncbi:MAG TPA: aspartyl protease family protein [Rhizomicrobium sp.]|nr:aspartyl protease family protein [Rhizomicrobium sp.]
MIRGLCLLLCVAGMARSQAAENKPATNCQLTRYAVLPMATQPDGRFAIPVSVMGHDASFLVDTGGVSATMTGQLAKDLDMNPKPTNRWLNGVGGSVLYTFVYAKTFSIGRLTGTEIPVYIDPRIGGLGLDGTLSPDMMSQFDVDIDFAKSTMNLFAPDHCPGQAVYWTKTPFLAIPMQVAANSGHIRIPVVLDGKEAIASIDTGADNTFMSMKVAEEFGITEKSPELKILHSFGAGGKFKEYSYPFKILDLGGITVKNPRVTIMSDEMLGGGLGREMTLGVSFLRQLHMYIAYKERKLYLTPAEAN